jgi:uncharacterized metal-binding protein
VACAKKLIEHLRLTVTDWVCVTDLGIKKSHDFKIVPKDIAVVMNYAKKSLATRPG